ncbi:TetR/AcrR family transcriptional regulator [Hydrogenophaga sp. OTU3427]|uniref:TetR/AcrR family transcriptional regulator n=1 Tax=Hydrogenophaga sp. OTU3427 TaxID=3043856 RepID=UPI00313B0A2E
MTAPDPTSTPSAERRPRGRPRKLPEARDDGNRRQELIRAAARLFRQHGFAATSTRDIAAACGMRSGSPFYHFDSKEVLLAAVMEEGMRFAIARQTEVLAGAGAPGQPLVARFRAMVRSHLDVLLGPDSDFIPVMLYEWRSLTPAQREAVVDLKNRYEAPWGDLLADLHAAGHLRGDPALARLLMFGALNWSAQWFDPARRATLDDVADAALQLFLKDVR